MSYERLKKKIDNVTNDLVKMVVSAKQESINRDNTLYQTVQKQGLYLETYLEYDMKFWFLPKGTYFGKKIFTSIFNRKTDEMNKAMLEAGKEVQKAEVERIKKLREDQSEKSKIKLIGG